MAANCCLPRVSSNEHPYRELQDSFVRQLLRRSAYYLVLRMTLTASSLKTLDKVGVYLLLELGAVLQLAEWEETGISQMVSCALPSADQARLLLIERVRRQEFDINPYTGLPLFRAIVTVWLHHLSWSARGVLDTDVIVDNLEDDVIEKLVEFAWKHRDDLGH